MERRVKPFTDNNPGGDTMTAGFKKVIEGEIISVDDTIYCSAMPKIENALLMIYLKAPEDGKRVRITIEEVE